MSERVSQDVLGMTARIVASHLGHNHVSADALPELIQAVYRALASAGHSESAKPSPAVPIRRSVFPDFLISLEDGRKLKTLKRYLQKTHGMTPADYRKKWGLPPDYPMVAPNYAASRSSHAKSIGLGRKRVSTTTQAEETQPDEPEVTLVTARRARGSRG